jgi:2-polyprenyl-3-methyl-5-hydroxy-6-metoxy-1,4-benzoquinol methylase
MLMAEAFPNSTFIGYDFHEASIAEATEHARAHGTAGNLSFEVSRAKELPRGGFDLITFFDCLHDMGDPAGAAASVRKALKPDGTWMVVEPMAADTVAGNLNPIGRIFYSASTMICVPTSKAQEVGAALGAQAGEARLRKIIEGAGFSKVRRATETPFNMILEARP